MWICDVYNEDGFEVITIFQALGQWLVISGHTTHITCGKSENVKAERQVIYTTHVYSTGKIDEN